MTTLQTRGLHKGSDMAASGASATTTAQDKFQACVRQALQKRTSDLAAALLKADDCEPGASGGDEAGAGGQAEAAETHVGVPRRPFLVGVTHALWRWGSRGTLRGFETLNLLQDDPEIALRVQNVLDEEAGNVAAAVASCEEDPEKAGELVATSLEHMGQLPVLRLLGLRLTPGTVTAVEEHRLWPPSAGELLQSFNRLHPADARPCKLTVGAKALAKHAVRHASWWGGELKGGEESKSKLAEEYALRFLLRAAWMNLHMLPHGKPTFEIRVAEGYGARWWFEQSIADGEPASASELHFRGFLEPQSEEGHENRWRH
ncbi:hypothetical protein DIPPA_15088 [Diplonema papillatum]|nr:hypothetical protein DIPPA_15088 [Diplonema papillatum]